MDEMMAQLQGWMGRSQAVEGRLTEAHSAVLDAFCEALAALQGLATLSPQAAAAVWNGLQIAQQTAQGDRQIGPGHWTYQIERLTPAGVQLTFRRASPDQAEAGFQVDNENRLFGTFYIQLDDPAAGKEFAFSLKQTPDGWALVRWQEEQEICSPLAAAPAEMAFWNPNPKVYFWDDLVPTDGQALTSWLAGPGTVSQPAKPLQENLALKVCAKCGAPLEPNVRFCGQCAAPVLAAQALAPLPAAATPVTPSQVQVSLPTMVAQAPTWHLVVKPGGQTIALKGNISIGREQDNDLRLDDQKLSRHHAVIEAAGKGWQVRDLGSTNGTGVNGQRISAPLLLKVGDVIELGDARLTLELR